MIFDPNNYRIENFTAQIDNYYVKSAVKQSDGLYTVTLEDGKVLQGCVEIFPNTKYYKTYTELSDAESVKLFETAFSDTASDSERIKAFTVLMNQEGRASCNIVENKTDGKYYFWLANSGSAQKIERMKEKIYYAHITEADVKEVYKLGVTNKDEDAAEALAKEKIASTTFKIDPYEPSNPDAVAVIKSYGTFFNADKTKVAVSSSTTMYIGIGMFSLIALFLSIYAYFYIYKKDKSKTDLSTNTVTKFSFGRIKRRRNVK